MMGDSNRWLQLTANNYDTTRTIVESRFNQYWGDQELGVNKASQWSKPAATGSKVDVTGLVAEYVQYDQMAKRTNALYRGTVDGHPVFVYVVEQPKEQSVFFSVISTSQRSIDKLQKQLDSKLIMPVAEENKTYIGLWHLSGRGEAIRERRAIDTRAWEAMHSNYTPHVAKTLSQLAGTTPADLDGRILLMWGPAGTGKTTFLRSIAAQWAKWASLEYVIDPENFLSNSDYMTQVLLDDDFEYDSDTDKQLTKLRWRLLILEDAGELIAKDAKKTAGQALSRLLNLTDGILGEGRNLLLGITTNDDISAMHPAVIRPGRCFAKVEIPEFTRTEAEDWLGPEYAGHFHQIGERATLAELYHIKKGLGKKPITTEEDAPVISTGQYL